jgi:hypothetical protein
LKILLFIVWRYKLFITQKEEGSLRMSTQTHTHSHSSV